MADLDEIIKELFTKKQEGVFIVPFGGVGGNINGEEIEPELGGNQFLLHDNGAWIMLDFGMNFDRMAKFYSFPFGPKKFRALETMLRLGIYPDIPGIYRQDYLKQMGRRPEDKTIDAFVFSHAHIDHIAGLHFLRHDMEVWMDRYSKIVAYSMQEWGNLPFSDFIDIHLWGEEFPKIREEGMKMHRGEGVRIARNFKCFRPPEPFQVKHVKITPYYVDHSLPGACGFIVDTSIGPLVFTGDLRMRGRRSENTINFMKAARSCNPRYLLCEGSLIHKRQVGNEKDLVNKTTEYMKRFDGLAVVSYPPRDLDRLESLYEVAKRTCRQLVITTGQARLLELMDGELGYPKLNRKYFSILKSRKNTGMERDSDYYKKEKKFFTEKKYEKQIVGIEDIAQNPSKYLVTLTLSSMDTVIDIEPPANSVYIRSHPEPYTEHMELDEKVMLHWLKKFNLYQPEQIDLLGQDDFSMAHAHITGHMSLEEKIMFVRTVVGKSKCMLLPIHTLYPDMFGDECGVPYEIPTIGNKVVLKKAY